MAEQIEQSEVEPFDDFYNSIREAKFVREEEDGYIFDLGDEQEALVGKDEFTIFPSFKDGESVNILVERPWGDLWTASIRKIEKLAIWDRMQELLDSGEVIPGTFVHLNKGGVSVDIDGIRAFAPKSQVDVHRVDDFRPYIGKPGKFRVTEFDKKRGNVVVSQRVVLEETLKESRAELMENLGPGQEFDGVVRNVVKYGAFVDIGGIEGLLHKSNLSWGRIDDPAEVLKPGQQIRVMVLDFDPGSDRLSLGHKQLQSDPWEALDTDLKEGDTVEGEVVSLADFGAFVSLQDGLEGLVHVTELSWLERVNHPSEKLNVGDKISVKIIGIDGENRRLSLSVKQLLPNPWEKVASDFPPGTKVTGKVSGTTDFGVFVEIADGIDGLVHVSDLSWTEKVDDPSTQFSEGDEVEVVVLEVDAEQARVSLGIKQLSEDPWDLAESIAGVGKKLDVTVTRLTEFGAFVEIVEGVEGLIHISELSEDRVGNPSEVVRPGQTVSALVMSFDRANQRIGLSLKRDELDEGEMREYVDEGSSTATLGDILRDRLGISEEE